ncbi:MAG: MBL fold metallo-hydrolase [Actinobacteria bacterium]|nr:MBL fold metallo-hydrolase [Actinomycetota bacterium]
MSVKKIMVRGMMGLSGFTLFAAGGLTVRYHLGRQRADRIWHESKYPPLQGLGAVKKLTIMPLIDFYASERGGEQLLGEPGVSYLVRADDTAILMDVGYNMRNEHPSPLLRNMKALGLDISELDMIFISHAHVDHLGGMAQQKRHSFALSARTSDLRGIPAYVPVSLSHPTARTEVVREPRVIAKGVASTGTIPRQLFFLGWTPEHSLAVNVEGRGIVLVVGCGHQSLQHIVERAEMVFDQPVYGIIGGLHYPVTASRQNILGLPVQCFIGTGKCPWDRITKEEVEENISFLQSRNPRIVGLSPHDSCDWSLGAFRDAFAGAYREIRVGEEIKI